MSESIGILAIAGFFAYVWLQPKLNEVSQAEIRHQIINSERHIPVMNKNLNTINWYNKDWAQLSEGSEYMLKNPKYVKSFNKGLQSIMSFPYRDELEPGNTKRFVQPGLQGRFQGQAVGTNQFGYNHENGIHNTTNQELLDPTSFHISTDTFNPQRIPIT